MPNIFAYSLNCDDVTCVYQTLPLVIKYIKDELKLPAHTFSPDKNWNFIKVYYDDGTNAVLDPAEYLEKKEISLEMVKQACTEAQKLINDSIKMYESFPPGAQFTGHLPTHLCPLQDVVLGILERILWEWKY